MDFKKEEKRIERSLRTQLNKIYKAFRHKNNLKLGVRLCDTQVEIFAYRDDRVIFGVDVSIYNYMDFEKKKRVVEFAAGSMGRFDPDGDSNAAMLSQLTTRTLNRWDVIRPLAKEAMEQYKVIVDEKLKKELEEHEKDLK